MLNRLLNSTGKKLRLYVAESKPGREAAAVSAPRPAREPRQKPEALAVKPAVVAGMSLPDALGRVANCGDPAEGLAMLEAAGLTPQRAALMGGISLSAYEALRDAAPTAPEWGAFRKSVAEWKNRLGHS